MKGRIKRKQIVCTICLLVLLAVCLGMTGCSFEAQEKEQQSEENRYVEQEVKLPSKAGEVLDVKAETGDSLNILCFNKKSIKGSVWNSVDQGKTWDKQGSFGNHLPLEKKDASQRQWRAALSADDEVFLWAVEEEGKKQVACVINYRTGETRELQLTGITRAEFAPDGALLLQTERGILQKTDPRSGKKLMEFSMEDSYPNAFSTCGQELYVFTNEKCYGFSLKDGKELPLPEAVEKAAANVDNSINFDSAEPQSFHIKKKGQDQYEVYSMTKDGISLFASEGKRLLLEGSETCLYTNSAWLYGFCKINREHLFAAADSDNGNCLYSYIYTPDKPVEKTELTMYTLTENKVFDKLISLYEREHPLVKINMQVGRTGDRAVTASDAVKALNTDLLAGKGPDLLCLNDLPVEHFVESGMLEDLSGEVVRVNEKEGLFTNITGCYERSGMLYAIPTQFSFMCAGGSEQVVKGAGDLTSLIDAIVAESKDAPALPEYAFNSYVLMLYRAFLTADGSEQKPLSETMIRSFYRQIGRLYRLYGTQEVLDAPEPMEEMGLGKAGYPSPQDYRNNNYKAFAQLCYVKLDIINDFAVMKALQNQKDIYYSFLGKKGNHMFLPHNIVGVSSKSRHKKEARDFAAFVLSSKGQECYYTPGIYSPAAPVNRTVAKELMKSRSSVLMEGVREETLSGQEIQEVLMLFENLSQPANTDGLLKDIVMEHLQSYLKGEKTLEQAAADAAKRLKLYLAE